MWLPQAEVDWGMHNRPDLNRLVRPRVPAQPGFHWVPTTSSRRPIGRSVELASGVDWDRPRPTVQRPRPKRLQWQSQTATTSYPTNDLESPPSSPRERLSTTMLNRSFNSLCVCPYQNSNNSLVDLANQGSKRRQDARRVNFFSKNNGSSRKC